MIEMSSPARFFSRHGRSAATILDDRLAELTKKQVFSGTVSIDCDGESMFRGAYGLASLEYGAKNMIETRFNIASIGKTFTAVAIAQLVERNMLTYDDPVGMHLDSSWLAERASRAVKIGQLLNHTSGLDTYFNERFRTSSLERFDDLDSFKSLIFDEVPAFSPGTAWHYSDTGYLLLGAVIASLRGDYFDYIQSEIFDRAGMQNTAALDLRLAPAGYAQGYFRALDNQFPAVPYHGDYRSFVREKAADEGRRQAVTLGWRNAIYRHPLRGGPAGGSYSTGSDLLRFMQALANGTLIDPVNATFLTTSSTPVAPHCGNGFLLIDGGYGHSGAFDGASAMMIAYPDNWRIALLSNIDGGAHVAFAAMLSLADD